MEFNQINSGKIIGYTNEGEQGSPIYENYLEDKKTGDLYQSISEPVYNYYGQVENYNYQPGQLLATGEALKNPDFKNLTNNYNWRGIVNPGEKYADPVQAQKLYDLKQTNPDQYYQQLATDISDQILGNWSMNKNEHNVALTNQLESIKEVNQPAYYQGQLNLLSKQVGWQHGQNSIERAADTQEKIKSLVPEAIKAGLTPEQIESIYGSSFSAASSQNQMRIANDAAGTGGGFNLGELVRGIAPVAALAIGGPLFSALSAPAAGVAGAAGSSAAGSGLSAAELLAVGGFTPTAGSGASFVVPSLLGGVGSGGIGLTGGAGGSTGLLGGTGGAGLSGAGSASGIAATQTAAGLGVPIGSALPAAGMAVGALPSTVGQLSAALPAPGSVGGAGMGLSAELAPGTILGSGLPGGGAIGASYALGANGLPATNLLGQAIPASSIGFGDIPATVTSGLNLGAKDIIDAARIGSQALSGGQQQPAQQQSASPQNVIPRGQVDYSGILNLLQARSPQRNIYSLLG